MLWNPSTDGHLLANANTNISILIILKYTYRNSREKPIQRIKCYFNSPSSALLPIRDSSWLCIINKIITLPFRDLQGKSYKLTLLLLNRLNPMSNLVKNWSKFRKIYKNFKGAQLQLDHTSKCPNLSPVAYILETLSWRWLYCHYNLYRKSNLQKS